MKKKYTGFTLLELSIVLIISSMLLTITFNSGKYFLEQNHIRATHVKLDTIQNALDIYLIQNRKLPCPAGLTIASGEELSSCITSSSSNGLFVNNGVARGWVPYEELNLTSDVAYDSWGDKITYSVSIDAVGNFTEMEDGFQGITIYDNTTSKLITNKAVYSLNSHGKNKLGAYNKDGSAITTTGISSAENVNVPSLSTSSNLFVYFSDYKTYDDIGKYKTRMQIIIDGNIEDISCYITSTIVSDLITNAGITDSPTFTVPTDNFLKYGNNIVSIDSEYKIKCFKYGRLGISKNE
ncbi:MAG: prepilin-type N-terminal cleavage/methylation domain-containing protein [Rickettsiales bacterium]|nr:prepilin-type N-terminal cleavage/methylation domain-containing protein [Rickettsiales bacterium]